MSPNQPPPHTTGPLDGQSAPPEGTVIIHHLSDLYRAATPDVPQLLNDYAVRLANQASRRPHILVITGNITQSGKSDELQDFVKAITTLATSTLQWDATKLHEHIFVVPGPHDIDWQSDRGNTGGYDAFAEACKAFTLPLLYGFGGKAPVHGEPYIFNKPLRTLVYLMNTCWQPEQKLPATMQPFPQEKAAVEQLLKDYRTVWGDFAKHTRDARQRVAELTQARATFQTEALRLFSRDHGVMRAEELQHFTEQMQLLAQGAVSAVSPAEFSAAAKIVVTHHPLLGFTGVVNSSEPPFGAEYAARSMRRFSAQMALHGHSHESHVTQDLATYTTGAQDETPIVQIGAASLSTLATGVTPSFNEVLVIPNQDAATWSVGVKPISLSFGQEHRSYFFSLAPVGASTATQSPIVVATSSSTHRRFEQDLGAVLRQFTLEMRENQLGAKWPQQPMFRLQQIIHQVIFEQKYETRIALRFKQPGNDGATILKPEYLVPVGDAQFIQIGYPDSLAAWAMILGEPVLFLHDFDSVERCNTYNIFDILRQTGKDAKVRQLLIDQAALFPANQQFASMRDAFINGTLTLKQTFKPWTTSPEKVGFNCFCCMPVPLLLDPASFRTMPEIAVLVVDIAPKLQDNVNEIFTNDRLGMLKAVSYAMETILLSSHALRRPRIDGLE
jgi:3',5'-cyclic AMP phosphodiesterase CpdA